MSNTSSSARCHAMMGPKVVAARTVLSSSQVAYLQSIFLVSSHIGLSTRECVALQLGVSKRVVQVWFQNRRQEIRRDRAMMTKAASLLLAMSASVN